MKFILINSIILAILLNYFIDCNNQQFYYCPPRTPWTLVAIGAGIPHCYQNLPPILRSELAAECSKIGGKPIIIDSLQTAQEVTTAMRIFKIYGTWLDATQVGPNYVWGDQKPVPNPSKWCECAKKDQSGVVYICPYPNYDTFTTETCCVSDREPVTKFASLCVSDPKQSCQYKQGFLLRNDPAIVNELTKIEVISSVYANEICCQKCALTPSCGVFNYYRRRNICILYSILTKVKDVSFISQGDGDPDHISGGLHSVFFSG